MAYVSYAVAPATPLGPRSVGALSGPSLAYIPTRDSGLTDDQKAVQNDAILQKLWDNTASYRVGLTDAQGASWFQCYRLHLDGNRCRADVLAASATDSTVHAGMFGMSTTTLLVLGGAAAGVAWLALR